MDSLSPERHSATIPAQAQRVLVLQGGGALGSYQAGAYQALCHHDFEPQWVAGISIGAINAAIIAGNERVLRARFADARHFWDLDRKTCLETRLPALDKVTFQAKLGSQGDRVRRLTALAAGIAPRVGADQTRTARAAARRSARGRR